jgi:hypothetical protein
MTRWWALTTFCNIKLSSCIQTKDGEKQREREKTENITQNNKFWEEQIAYFPFI